MSNETKIKMSISRKGIKKSKETKEKMKIAQQKRFNNKSNSPD